MRALAFLFILAAAAAAAAAVAMQDFDTSALPLEPGVEIEVPLGAGPQRIVRQLERDGLLRPDPRWQVWLRWRRPEPCQHPGTHVIAEPMTPAEFLNALCEDQLRPDIRVTLPEGETRWQVADRLSAAGVVDRDIFIAATEDPELLASLGISAPHAEGYLFPDTYAFFPDTPAAEVVERMVERFNGRMAAILADHHGALESYLAAPGASLDQLFTMASLIEAEAQVADERAKIAQVFWNRLDRGMKLQTDPTCVYTSERYGQVPTPHDCRGWANPYSTYLIDGLPPTPIAGFRPESLEAALRPSGDRSLLYFVAMQDGSGRHVFSSTLREHNENVRRYLRGR